MDGSTQVSICVDNEDEDATGDTGVIDDKTEIFEDEYGRRYQWNPRLQITEWLDQVWNGNFQDLQIDVEISEISGNNLWKFPKFPNVRAFYMGDFRFSAKSRDFRWYSSFF